MTTVVTGATGHVGANLVRALLAQGRRVRALIHINRRAIEGLDVEIVEGDVCDVASLRGAFNGAEVVYHLAARISISMGEWPLLERINVTGTRNVVEACLRSGVRRLVHFSSIHAIIQEPLDVPVDELRPLVESKRCPPYDRSKATGEREVHKGIEQGLDAVIIIPTGIIGPYDYEPSYFGEALLTIARGKLPALIAGGFDWVDVRDVVEGAMRAEERAPAGARYLLSGHWVSVPEIAAIVEQATGAPVPRLVCPMWLAPAGIPFTTALARLTGKRPLYTSASLRALCGNRNISHERATRDLDYNPRPFRETIVDTLQWFEENGYLGRRLVDTIP
jgi:dihydroflavonol-4-reductase